MAIEIDLVHYNTWLCSGDCNEAPQNSAFGSVLRVYGGSILDMHRATRWEGDWFCCNSLNLAEQGPNILHQKMSDHIPLTVVLPCRAVDLEFRYQVRGCNWKRPAWVEDDIWRQVLQECWGTMSSPTELRSGLLA